MKVIVKCAKCGKVLVFTPVLTVMNEIILKVAPCNNLDCIDCSNCEEKQRADKLADDLQTLKRKY